MRIQSTSYDSRYLGDARWEYRDCLVLGDKGYLSAEVRKNLFETANITLEVPISAESEKLEIAFVGLQEISKTD